MGYLNLKETGHDAKRNGLHPVAAERGKKKQLLRSDPTPSLNTIKSALTTWGRADQYAARKKGTGRVCSAAKTLSILQR